jgi:hypothetical protein
MRPVRRANNLASLMCQLSWNHGSRNLLEPSGPVQSCIGITFNNTLYTNLHSVMS